MFRRVLAMFVLVVAAVVAAPAPAFAATIAVTTTADVVNKDKLISLREALTSANLAKGSTTIVLSAATYELDLCGPSDDTNATGDLDYTSTHALTIDGDGATIVQTCANQRVLHLTNSAAVTVQDATISGGDVSAGAGILYRGTLLLDGVTVAENDATVGGYAVAYQPGLTVNHLQLVDTTVGPNIGTGLNVGNATVTLTDSMLYANTARGAYLVDAALTVTGTVVTQNGRDGLMTTGVGDGLVTVTSSTFSNNDGAGLLCSACGSLTVTGSVISGNHPQAGYVAGGVVVYLQQDDADDQPTISIVDTTISGNTRNGPGGGLSVLSLVLSNNPPPAQTVITRSTISSNGNAPLSNAVGGGVYVATGDLRLDNSTVTGNVGRGGGGGLYAVDDIHLRHATVYGNFGPASTDLAAGDDLYAFGSIVALGTAGYDECDVGGSTVSTGYNVGGDGSCGFAGVGDQNAVGNVHLLSLTNNGGPTKTILPAAASAAVGAVPAAQCTVLTTDQRGVARPQGTNCEAGAAEIA